MFYERDKKEAIVILWACNEGRETLANDWELRSLLKADTGEGMFR